MRAAEIRSTFLDYFRERGHKVFPSASLVPDDPRAPLLTTAGMVQFIPYFYGEKSLDPPRAASCQVVARTTDIDIVGLDARHQSVYEMLGNWSFGDYFKEESIRWAWELSTGGFGLEPSRIWVTVYQDDDESARIWREVVGLPDERIVRRGKADNFWWMEGVPGPGGPNTELFYDRGPAYGEAEGFQDGDRIMEFWNLVFMQYEVDAHGDPLGDLPAKSVDTGLGLERMAQILQEVPTAYEADTFRPILARAEELTAKQYRKDERTDISLRIIAEHMRAATFMVGDGILPSNEGRGYVLRRVFRRAIRHAKLLGVDDAIAPAMVEAVVSTMGTAYPNLSARDAFITNILGGEEEGFRETVGRGMQMLDTAVAAASGTLGGDVAFKLHDTFGFPFELTLEIARDAGVEVDQEAFETLMTEQRERARAARKTEVGDSDALARVLADTGPSLFVGHERDGEEAKVLGIIRDGAVVTEAPEGAEVELILDVTPFYAEGGGQVGDRGLIEFDEGRAEVLDTQRRLDALVVHRAKVTAGGLATGTAVRAQVDPVHRASTMRSHTATHILHATLRAALGEHARQAGSLVEPGRLRFDFPHFDRVDPQILARVEQQVNERLVTDDLVRPYETTMDEARSRGAMMLFEEKYGDIVRVVEIGEYSIELCGGTHVTHTSAVGAVKILGEGSIGANLRRVEALTGAEAIEGFRRSEAVLEHIAGLLRTTPAEAPARVERLLADLKEAEAASRARAQAGQREQAASLAGGAGRIGGTAVVIAEVAGLGVDGLRKLVTEVRATLGGPAAVVCGSVADGKPGLAAAVDEATLRRGITAKHLLTDAAKAIGGGAGGKDDLATGGGKKADGIAEALRLARAAMEELLA